MEKVLDKKNVAVGQRLAEEMAIAGICPSIVSDLTEKTRKERIPEEEIERVLSGDICRKTDGPIIFEIVHKVGREGNLSREEAVDLAFNSFLDAGFIGTDSEEGFPIN